MCAWFTRLDSIGIDQNHKPYSWEIRLNNTSRKGIELLNVCFACTKPPLTLFLAILHSIEHRRRTNSLVLLLATQSSSPFSLSVHTPHSHKLCYMHLSIWFTKLKKLFVRNSLCIASIVPHTHEYYTYIYGRLYIYEDKGHIICIHELKAVGKCFC